MLHPNSGFAPTRRAHGGARTVQERQSPDILSLPKRWQNPARLAPQASLCLQPMRALTIAMYGRGHGTLKRSLHVPRRLQIRRPVRHGRPILRDSTFTAAQTGPACVEIAQVEQRRQFRGHHMATRTSNGHYGRNDCPPCPLPLHSFPLRPTSLPGACLQ